MNTETLESRTNHSLKNNSLSFISYLKWLCLLEIMNGSKFCLNFNCKLIDVLTAIQLRSLLFCKLFPSSLLNGAAQLSYLIATIIKIVLSSDVITLRSKYRCEDVAIITAPGIHQDQWAGRVCTNELNIYFFTTTYGRFAITLGCSRSEPLVIVFAQANIHKSGASHLAARNAGRFF